MHRQITVRTGAAEDAAAVAALYAASRRWAYAGLLPEDLLDEGMQAAQAELWALRLGVDYGEPSATPTLLIAECAGEPVGFAYLVPEPDGRVLLDSLYVDPDRIGTGVGRRLFETARERAAGPLHLEVLRDNARAVAFYERAGGARVGEGVAHFPAGLTRPAYLYAWPPAES